MGNLMPRKKRNISRIKTKEWKNTTIKSTIIIRKIKLRIKLSKILT